MQKAETVLSILKQKSKDIVKKYRKRGTPMPNWVWLMSYMKRKTLVLCHDCHVNLHNGTL